MLLASQHLCCMLLPQGIRTTEEMDEVDPDLELKDNFSLVLMGKWASLTQSMWRITFLSRFQTNTSLFDEKEHSAAEVQELLKDEQIRKSPSPGHPK